MLAFLTIQRIAISINQSINEVLTFVFALLRRREVGVIEGQSIRGSAAGGVAGRAQTKHHQNSSIEMKQVHVENLF